MLSFVVHDTGVGIPDKDLVNLYKPFSRIEKNSLLAKGSGFGLYVVKGLVDLLQGNIAIQSKESEGTRVEIRIPCEKVNPEQTNVDEPVSDTYCLSNEKHKLLVIDDDNSLLSMLQEMILRLGHEVTVCNSLQEFETHLPNIATYELVLTDMEMGDYSGIDILEKVRKTNPQTPVVVMTARSDYGKIKALSHGFDGYLPKPFTLKLLQNLLGMETKETITDTSSHSTEDFKLLHEMFDGDMETITSILNVFVNTTTDNLLSLQQMVDEDNFKMTQSLCHKMLPMFAQLEDTETVTILKKMDSMRERNADEYPLWKEDMIEFIRLSNLLINFIKEK